VSSAVAWLETGTASPHQECPPRRSLLIEEVVRVHYWDRSTQGVATAAAIDRHEQVVGELSVRADCHQPTSCCVGRRRSRRGCGQSKVRRVSGPCRRNNCRCGGNSRRRSARTVRRECVCWTQVARTRPTSTTPGHPSRRDRCLTSQASAAGRARGSPAGIAVFGAASSPARRRSDPGDLPVACSAMRDDRRRPRQEICPQNVPLWSSESSVRLGKLNPAWPAEP